MKQHIRASIEVAGDCAAILAQLRDALVVGEKRFTIHVPLSDFSIPGNLWLSKPITVTARLTQYSANMPDDLQVGFQPSVPSPLFPAFSGNLSTRPADADARTILELTGTYEPPLGSIGQAVDGAIGHRIAQRSIENLLAKMARQCAATPSTTPTRT